MFSCSENNETQPDFAKDYGRGLYIATDNGISFYDGDTLINNAFRNVNGIALSDVNKIKFSSNKIYILSDNQLNVANVNTLENLGSLSHMGAKLIGSSLWQTNKIPVFTPLVTKFVKATTCFVPLDVIASGN